MTEFFSGGAVGADYYFTKYATEAGYVVNIVLYKGLKPHLNGINAVDIITVDHTDLIKADPCIYLCAKLMDKQLPTRNSNYIRRDYHIIKDVDAVFAVGKRNFFLKSQSIEGGTGWGCEMYLQTCLYPKLFFYDVKKNKWYTYKASSFNEDPDHEDQSNLVEIDSPPSPTSFKKCALIGTRDITPEAIQVIKGLFIK